MKALFLFAVLLLCSTLASSNVIEISQNSWDDVVKQGPILVEFFAPWCGHCKKLAPEYAKAAQILAERNSPLRLGSVDCTVEEELAQRFQISGFPTIKFFLPDREEPIDYQGERTAEAIISWMEKKTGPIAQTIQSKADLDAFVAAHDPAVVGFYTNDAARETFFKLAGNPGLDGYNFGEVRDSALIKELGEKDNSLKLFRSFDSPLVLEGELPKPESFVSWVLGHGHRYLEEARSSWGRSMQRGLPIVLLFAESTEAPFVSLEAWFSHIAKKYIDSFSFGYVGNELFSRLPTLGASGEKIPTVVVINGQTGKNYPFDENTEFNEENVEAFLKGVADGSIKPHFKSQEEPTENSGPVKVLVGNSFQKLVLDSDADVLVEFYAPWCGHCKQLAPTWDALGKHFEGNDKIVIAKLDGTLNDNPSVGIRGYPTIYLFVAGDKANPIQYNGNRSLEDLIDFVNKHAKNAKPGDATRHATHDEL